ncbi:conserved protein, unknown function [Hepatocystis sp. ex Piliocolobus tephrosceles]|nr:conserved protein, unknown function [Hepatocystis sp. ex Piliocolobus tephrosceles]
MIDFVKKYIYVELLLCLAAINYWTKIDNKTNIIIVTYLTFLGFIYLIYKLKYSNHKTNISTCNFRGKHVCILGGSEGLGLSLAKRIIKERPYTISLLARNINKLKEAKSVLLNLMENIGKPFNVRINIIQCDISMKESINNAYNDLLNNKSLDSTEFEVDNINTTYVCDDKTENSNIKKRQNTKKKNKKEDAKDMLYEENESKQNYSDLNFIDILICNAAYVSTEENNKLEMYDLLYTVNTNIYGNIDFISRVLLHMKKTKKGGVILFINTEGTLYPIYGYSYYLMSKSCMWTYTHILDQELKYYNIHIANAFLPSLETPGYIIENLKKPQITKHIENLTTTLNSDYAANKVINKIKQGNKFITLNFNGYMLSVLHSGYRHPDSYFDYIIYVTFCNIFVFISSLYKIYIEYIIKSKITGGLT